MVACLFRTGQTIFTGSSDGVLTQWSLVNGKVLEIFKGHQDAITDLDMNYENTLLASSSFDQTIRIWNLKTKRCIALLDELSEVVSGVKFSPNCHVQQRFLVSVGDDGFICFWEWNKSDFSFNLTPRKYQEKHQFNNEIFPFSFSSCGLYLCTDYNEIRIYYFGNWYPIRQDGLKGHTNKIECIQFANNSIQFASGSKDGNIIIWSFERNIWRATLIDALKRSSMEQEFEVNIEFVNWSCDDSLIITTDSNNRIKVWEIRSGRLVHNLSFHSDQILSIEPNPRNPRLLLSSGADGQVNLWNFFNGEILKKFIIENEEENNKNVVIKAIWPIKGTSFVAVDLKGFLMIFDLIE
jgi:WD40 repeat protein